MEHDITETIKKQLSQETGMKALRNRQFSQSRDIQQIKETLNDLVNSDALISRGRKKAVLNKESVYDRFGEQGLTKRQVLELLDEAGLIFPYSPGNRTSVCWDGNKQTSIYLNMIMELYPHQTKALLETQSFNKERVILKK